MKKAAFILAAVSAVLLCASEARADTLQIFKQTLRSTSLSTATAINAAAYTGWREVGDKRSIVFEITYVYSSATAVTMKCWTTDDASTANGSGFELHVLSDSATIGTSTSVQHIWSNAISAASENWTWTVANLPHAFINCRFDGTGAGAADTIIVKDRGVTP